MDTTEEYSAKVEDGEYREKVTSLMTVIKNARLTLEGYVWDSKSADGFKYTGKPLASTRIIDLLIALLTPYTNNVNLITVKDWDTFNRQQLWFSKEVNKILHTDPYSIVQNYTQIFQIIDDTFQNILDIILGSKDFMRNALDNGEKERVTL